MRRTSLLAGLVSLALASGCSSSSGQPRVLDGVPPADASTTTLPVDASGADATARDGAGDAASCVLAGDAGCNALELCGPEVTEVDLTTPSPTPAGGMIYNGTYVLTSFTFFQTGTTVENATERQIYVISGGADVGASDGGIEASVGDAGASDGGADGGATLPEAGPTVLVVQEFVELPPKAPTTDTWNVQLGASAELTWAPTCGVGPRFLAQYTATTSQLSLFVDVSGLGTSVATYTRQ
jgi:hypothetical protein